MIPAKDLRNNAKNWRIHDDAQKEAMRDILATVGFADAVIAREDDDGVLHLIDGHLRREIMESEDMDVPVIIVDLSESEADFVLATKDPIAAMAKGNAEAYDSLILDLTSAQIEMSESVEALLDQTAANCFVETSKALSRAELEKKARPGEPTEHFAYLSVDKIKIPLTPEEHHQLLTLINEHCSAKKTIFGFFRAFFTVSDYSNFGECWAGWGGELGTDPRELWEQQEASKEKIQKNLEAAGAIATEDGSEAEGPQPKKSRKKATSAPNAESPEVEESTNGQLDIGEWDKQSSVGNGALTTV